MNNPQSIHPNAEIINDAVCSLLTTGDRTAFESLPQETQVALMGKSKLIATALFKPAMSQFKLKAGQHA